MKVTQLDLAGQGSWHDLSVERLSPELNVVYGPPQTGKSAVAQLAAHLLYGKSAIDWRRPTSSATPLAEGSLTVASPHGDYVLRRRRDGSPQGRLLVAAANGTAVDGRVVRTLLGDVSPQLLAELYAVDFAVAPRAQTLLDSDFSRQFTRAISSEQEPSRPLDRRRVDDLVRRRDEVVRQIELQMSGQLRESAAVEEELAKVDALLAARRHEAEQARIRLNAVQSQLAEVEARLRVVSLESAVRRGPVVEAEEHRAQLERLDAEIACCRQMLADLQARQATVRRELAEVQPDGAAGSVNVLADQRATVGVLERLIDDLDAEVSQLARALEPGRSLGPDAHARLAPVAEMLRQQVYALCGQVTEHERGTRRAALGAESRQLDRAQTDLSEQLGFLLDRRQSLVHVAELAARPTVTLPQAPAPQHCQCQRHDDFMRRSTAALLARPDRGRHEEAARRRRGELERERDVLRSSCDALDRNVQELAERWQRLQRGRARAGRSTLDGLRAELERLETEINRALIVPGLAAGPMVGGATGRSVWKASDALAQLTGGRLTQVRLVRDGREAVIVDDAGRAHSPGALPAAQQDQLYLALTLALVSSFGERGVDLPLVLDEPFLRQDAVGVRAMAGVLGEFAREGRQVLVFTADAEAARAFTAQGVDVRDIDQLRRRDRVSPPAPTVVAENAVRVVREPIGQSAPKLRLAGHAIGMSEEQDVYYLTLDAPLAEFPVLGNETAAIFAGLGLRTVDDLLAADAAEVARGLKRSSVSADAVRLWQRHMSLMCFLPGVSLGDAQVLVACEISSPAALYTVDVPRLADAVANFLASERGRRFAAARQRLGRARLTELQKLARRGRSRWQEASRRYSWVELQRPKRTRTVRAAARVNKNRQVKPAGRLPLRFLLERTSPVTAAPSVTRRAGELLAKAGIRTVADLLNANPESTAQELAVSAVNAALVGRWQSEARLAVRIPELRRSAARLLVACGFTEPEQIVGVGREELTKRVNSLCRTPAGRRLLGKNRRPSAELIATWIRRASHTRPLEAA
jgi:hypothetical protein